MKGYKISKNFQPSTYNPTSSKHLFYNKCTVWDKFPQKIRLQRNTFFSPFSKVNFSDISGYNYPTLYTLPFFMPRKFQQAILRLSSYIVPGCIEISNFILQHLIFSLFSILHQIFNSSFDFDCCLFHFKCRLKLLCNSYIKMIISL